MTQIVAIANQKGGVGKTTTALNLGVALVQKQRRVLLIDLDPQGGLSIFLGFDPHRIERSSYSLLMFEGMTITRTLQPVRSGLALIPGSIDLAAAAVKIIQEQQPLDRLRRALRSSRIAFDFVLIDTPPSLDVMTAISMVAAHEVLIPAQCHFMAIHGIRAVKDTINRIKEDLGNPDLKLLGVLPTMYDPNADYAQRVVEELRAVLPGQVFNTLIPYDVRLLDSPYHGRPVIEDTPDSPSASAYRALASEILALNGGPAEPSSSND